jgi:hypothetical protein
VASARDDEATGAAGADRNGQRRGNLAGGQLAEEAATAPAAAAAAADAARSAAAAGAAAGAGADEDELHELRPGGLGPGAAGGVERLDVDGSAGRES